MEYETDLNGPVFILGSAFFYEFQVGYDLASKPPRISFKDAPCGSCDETTELASSKAKVDSVLGPGNRNKRPRKVRGERMPSVDINNPL